MITAQRSVARKGAVKINRVAKKPFTGFRPMIRSRHPSHEILRTALSKNRFRSVVRLGSTTTITDGKSRIEINSVQSIRNSANKLLMKRCFSNAGVKTANWYTIDSGDHAVRIHNCDGNGGDGCITTGEVRYPIIAKHIFGSRGTGNTKLDTKEQLERWLQGKTLSNYIFEEFYTYSREYRLHVSKNGCFYTCRKMLRSDAPKENNWQRHDDNCVWILEENPSFDKPVNWDVIVADCVKALKAVGLDIGGFDVKVQGRVDQRGRVRQNPEYIIIESNSACSFGEKTAEKYIKELNTLINDKYINGSSR